MKLIGKLIVFCGKVYGRLLMYALRPLFGGHGKNFRFEPRGSSFSFATIFVGDDVYIGDGAYLTATRSRITIGNKVMLAPHVSMIAGDHNAAEIGRFMRDVKEKRPQDDLPIVVEEDVWIGANVTILKGVTIRRGSIVAAGAVVNRSFPPYSILGGLPARVLKPRFDIATILRHEEGLYPPAQRLSKESLEAMEWTKPASQAAK